MDSHNYYFEQLVIDSDLDDIYSDANAMERLAIARAHGLCQGSPADAAKSGGILSGLVVTKVDSKTVQVTAGLARDTDGKLVDVLTNCTVSLVNLGQTDVGDVTALGDGIPIVITAAKEAWLSLYLQYGEIASDIREDGNADPVSYRITESFRFYIGLGAEATPPAFDRVGISSYLDVSVIHLADILLDAAENIRVINPGSGDLDVICGSNEDFDRFAAYAAMTGRRSDWIALEDPTDFPQFALQNTYLRKGTPREALYDLVKKLQAEASPGGTYLLGAKAQAGTDTPSYSRTHSLAAGSIGAQLVDLLLEINGKIGRAGCMPAPFYDDFLYVPKQDSRVWSPDSDSPLWGRDEVGSGAITLSNNTRSCVILTSGNSPGDYTGLKLGNSASGTGRSREMFTPGSTNYCVAVCVQLGTDAKFSFGFEMSGGATGLAEVIVDRFAGTAIAHVKDVAGGHEATSSSELVPTSAFLTIMLEIYAGGLMVYVRNGADGTGQTVTCTGGLGVGTPYQFFMRTHYNNSLFRNAYVDAVSIGELSSRYNP